MPPGQASNEAAVNTDTHHSVVVNITPQSPSSVTPQSDDTHLGPPPHYYPPNQTADLPTYEEAVDPNGTD